MIRKYLFLLGLVAALLCGPPLAMAQSQPGVPMPGPNTPPPSPSNPPPPITHAQGPQQPPASLPPEVRNAPYNGPGMHLPAGITLRVPRDRSDAERVLAELAPQDQTRLQQAAEQNRQRRAAAQAMAQRARGGDRSLPTQAEQSTLGHGYSPTQQRAVPPRRSETPLNQAMNLLGFRGLDSTPTEGPDADPSLQPDTQSAQGACAVYALFYQDFDQELHSDLLVAQSLNTCGYGITTGQLPLYKIDHLETSHHAYRCSWYFSWMDFCLAPIYWVSFFPYCELYGAHAYMWCGPQGWVVPDQPAGYFIRAFGNVTTTDGLFGFSFDDSTNIGYKCNLGRYDARCS